MYKKITYIFILTLMITSCGDTWSSIKRGMTGAKTKSTDEFLVQKKDPLVLPPNYDSLPTPEDRSVATMEQSKIELKLKPSSASETSNLKSSTTEESILKKINAK